MTAPADITWDDVSGVAPELGGTKVDSAAQDRYLKLANKRVNQAHFPDEGDSDWTTLQLARIYLAAHFAVVGGYGNVSGPIASESLGSSSTSYASSTSDSLLGSTQYGRAFSQLVRTSTAVLGFTTGPCR